MSSSPRANVVVVPVPSLIFTSASDEMVTLAVFASKTRTRLTGAVPELRAGVVVRENLVVRRAMLRIPLRAVLAHADSVAPAVAADQEARRFPSAPAA